MPTVATCGYDFVVTSTGIRELKDNLSRYIPRIEAGERMAITAHGRVVAELVPPGAKTKDATNRFNELVAWSDSSAARGWRPDRRLEGYPTFGWNWRRVD
jgi:antitoxin (DNA-binding transcriptional repressor) of toxin-antitoxin stability system